MAVAFKVTADGTFPNVTPGKEYIAVAVDTVLYQPVDHYEAVVVDETGELQTIHVVKPSKPEEVGTIPPKLLGK